MPLSARHQTVWSTDKKPSEMTLNENETKTCGIPAFLEKNVEHVRLIKVNDQVRRLQTIIRDR